jgi:hypothetical protein
MPGDHFYELTEPSEVIHEIIDSEEAETFNYFLET